MVARLERPIVTLTTDFGSNSPYVAQMKGVLLSRNPNVQIVDVTHEIAPQDIPGAALVLDDVCCRFPVKTIHIVVVDPGVGTNRDMVFARLGDFEFLAPDNGVLTRLAARLPLKLAVTLTNPLYFMPVVSRTFHGRDILAPVAAHLSLGLNPRRLGEVRKQLLTISVPTPRVELGRIVGEIIQIDRFGNLITNITASELKALTNPAAATVACKETRIAGIVSAYGDRPGGSLVALVGSTDRLELAAVNANAAEKIQGRVGDEVTVLA